MKTIQPVSIWDNGIDINATILNAYGTNVILNTSATFTWELRYEEQNGRLKILTQGQIYMSPEEYAKWNTDDVAWDFIAEKLKLTITGDYIPPVPVPPVPEITEPNN